jgi:uncharacterized membrane protein (UPF0127 family)
MGPMRRASLVLLFMVVAVASCSSDPEPSDAATPRGSGTPLSVHTSDGVVRFDVEVADDAQARAIGLMHREELAPFDGMAFVWDEPVHTSFWMKDTLIPLSIAFWDEQGRIVAILDMEPCRADPCQTYDPGTSFVGALEVDRGRFTAEGIEVGDRIELAVAGR